MEREIQKTVIKSTLQFIDPDTLQKDFEVRLGIVPTTRYVEKLRVKIQEENPDYLILATFTEIINPEYSPLKIDVTHDKENFV